MNRIPVNHTILDLAGETCFGIDLGPTGSRRALARMFSPQGKSGLLVKDGAVTAWELLGVVERESRLYLYGPRLEAEGFFEFFSSPEGTEEAGRQERLKRLGLLLEALEVLAVAGKLPDRLYPGGIFFPRQGGVLFLPESEMAKALGILPLEKKIGEHEVLNHPDLAGEKALSFTLACLAYDILTGVLPWNESREEDLHEAMRSRPPLPAALQSPGIREEVSAFLHKALTENEKPGLKDWKAALAAWETGGVESLLTPEEREAKKKEALRLGEKLGEEQGRREFWRKNKTRVLLGAAVLAVVLAVGWSVASNLLKPRSTRGFSPEDVVKTFYTSMNGLDHAAMSDCVLGDAGKGYIDETLNLFVISRMRLSTEMTTGFLDIADWDRQGRPAPPQGKVVFGILNFSLSPREGSPDEPSFIVSFEHWAPAPDEDKTGQGPRPRGTEIKERVTLKKDKGDWVIRSLQRLSEKAL